jgi:MraZ protein
MIFSGFAEATIDAKQRLAVPSKFRARLDPDRHGKAFYCVPWQGGGLMLFPEKTFEMFAQQAEGTLTPGEEEQEFETTFFGLAEYLEMDSMGRIVIPRQHLELTRLPNEVVVVGARTRLEVLDRTAWKAQMPARFERQALLARRLRNSARLGDGATGERTNA